MMNFQDRIGCRRNYLARPLALALALVGMIGTGHAQNQPPLFPGLSELRANLTAGGVPVSGQVEVRMQLFNATTGGQPLTATPLVQSVSAVNGAFASPLDVFHLAGGDTVSIRDCFHNAQTGFLQISVRRPEESDFTPLEPRQSLGALPLSLYAGNAINAGRAQVADALAAGALQPSALLLQPGAGAPLNGQVLTFHDSGFSWTDPATGGGLVPEADGSLVLRLQVGPVLRLLPGRSSIYNSDTPNLVGGSPGNLVSTNTAGNVIAGGGILGKPNFAGGEFGFMGAGTENVISTNAISASIVAGSENTIGAASSYSFIGAGGGVTIGTNAPYVFAGAPSSASVGDESGMSVLAGGFYGKIGKNSRLSVVGGGHASWIGDNSPGSVIAGGLDNKIAISGSAATIGGGEGNIIRTNAAGLGGESATIAGGANNHIEGDPSATIGGGAINSILSANSSTIAGGSENLVDNAGWGVIGGGELNHLSYNSYWSTIPGGRANVIGQNAHYSLAGGYAAQALHRGSFVWNDSSDDGKPFQSISENEFAIHARNGVRILTGGVGLNVDGVQITGGGAAGFSLADGGVTTPKLALGAVTADRIATASAPSDGQALVYDATAGLSWRTLSSSSGGINVVAGGQDNHVADGTAWNVIGGGGMNNIANLAGGGVIGGGAENRIETGVNYGTIPGGTQNRVTANGGFAAGMGARSIHANTFVWSDGNTTQPFPSVRENEFAIHAGGGVRIETGGRGLTVDGVPFGQGTVQNGGPVNAVQQVAGGIAVVGRAPTDGTGVYGEGAHVGIEAHGLSGGTAFKASSDAGGLAADLNGATRVTGRLSVNGTAGATQPAAEIVGQAGATALHVAAADPRGTSSDVAARIEGKTRVEGQLEVVPHATDQSTTHTVVTTARHGGAAIMATDADRNTATPGYAGYFNGRVAINGAIHVPGAGVGTGTAVFIVGANATWRRLDSVGGLGRVTLTPDPGNSDTFIIGATSTLNDPAVLDQSRATEIDHPLCNGDPNAMLIVTPRKRGAKTATSAITPVPFTTWYDTDHGRWNIVAFRSVVTAVQNGKILQSDGPDLWTQQNGLATEFTVMVVKP